jgi:hypothetical protein
MSVGEVCSNPCAATTPTRVRARTTIATSSRKRLAERRVRRSRGRGKATIPAIHKGTQPRYPTSPTDGKGCATWATSCASSQNSCPPSQLAQPAAKNSQALRLDVSRFAATRHPPSATVAQHVQPPSAHHTTVLAPPTRLSSPTANSKSRQKHAMKAMRRSDIKAAPREAKAIGSYTHPLDHRERNRNRASIHVEDEARQ